MSNYGTGHYFQKTKSKNHILVAKMFSSQGSCYGDILRAAFRVLSETYVKLNNQASTLRKRYVDAQEDDL